jgi:CheY-like chemotaxis protein
MGKDALQLALKAGASRVLTKASCTPRHVIDEVRSSLAERKPRIATPAAGQSEAALRAALQNRVPGLVTQLRPIVDRIVNNDSSSFGPDLLELHRAMHAVSTTAALAGFGTLAQMASALELLLVELRTSPEKANSSTVHTMNQAVAFMSVLIERKGSEEYEPLSPLILVVDDDELSREVLCLALERASLRAVSLGDPALASRLLEECGFDLVFLDVNMPGMNGFEVCRNLRANPMNAQTPVVFVTALADFETRVQSRWMGVTDFVAKPIVLSELPVKALLYLLGSRVGWDGVPSGVDIATTNAAHSHPAKAAAAPASLARA